MSRQFSRKTRLRLIAGAGERVQHQLALFELYWALVRRIGEHEAGKLLPQLAQYLLAYFIQLRMVSGLHKQLKHTGLFFKCYQLIV